jgi:hypothetical protein
MIQPGSKVRFVRMPDWVFLLPVESRRIFEFCLGRTFRVEQIDEHGLLVLDVGEDINARFGNLLDDIRLDAWCLEEVSKSR